MIRDSGLSPGFATLIVLWTLALLALLGTQLLTTARQDADGLLSDARGRLSELDAETDRIWAERHRIVEDAHSLASQLLALAEAAVERFPAAEEHTVEVEKPFDGDDEVLGEPGAEGEPGGVGETDATAVLEPVEPPEDDPV